MDAEEISPEFEENSTCSILEHMGNDGTQRYATKYYNLDAILSVGYRVNSRKTFRKAHDRFLIIDDTVYHVGASFKDLGKKLTAFSKMEIMTTDEFITYLES